MQEGRLVVQSDVASADRAAAAAQDLMTAAVGLWEADAGEGMLCAASKSTSPRPRHL